MRFPPKVFVVERVVIIQKNQIIGKLFYIFKFRGVDEGMLRRNLIVMIVNSVDDRDYWPMKHIEKPKFNSFSDLTRNFLKILTFRWCNPGTRNSPVTCKICNFWLPFLDTRRWNHFARHLLDMTTFHNDRTRLPVCTFAAPLPVRLFYLKNDNWKRTKLPFSFYHSRNSLSNLINIFSFDSH